MKAIQKEVLKMTYNPITGNYLTRKFKQIFPTTESFIDEYEKSDLYVEGYGLDRTYVQILYALLYAEYGNSTIRSADENQFKYEVFSTMFMYGPTWVKRLEVQKDLRGLSAEDLRQGAKAIYNSALNPSQQPSTATLEELTYINSQNTTNYKKGKLESYALLIELLKTDVSGEFVRKFKKFFALIVQPDRPLWYITTPEEQEILDKE